MNRVTGTYRSRKVLLDQPVDWPDGMPVKVLCECGPEIAAAWEGADLCFDGSPWEDTPGAVQNWVQWFDSLQPVLTGQELERFEAGVRSARDEQKVLLPKWQEKIDNLRK